MKNSDDIKKLLIELRKIIYRSFIKKVFVSLIRISTYLIFFLTILELVFSFFPIIFIIYFTDALFLIGVIIFIVIFIKNSISIKNSELKTAKKIELKVGKPHQYIATAVELYNDKQLNKNTLSTEVYKTAYSNISQYKKEKKYKHIFLKRVLNWHTILLLFAIFALSITDVFVSPKLTNWLKFPITKTSAEIDIIPGDITIATGDSVELICKIENMQFPSLFINIAQRENGSRDIQKQLFADSLGQYRFYTGALKESIRYNFIYGGKKGKVSTVTVLPIPKLYSLKTTIYPPRYTGKKSYSLNEGEGDIIAPVGSIAKFEILVNSVLKMANIKSMKKTVPMEVLNQSATAKMGIYYDKKFFFEFIDSLNQSSDTTPQFFVSSIPDEKPTVKISRPGMDIALSIAQKETLTVEGFDDYGFSTVTLFWKRSGVFDSSTYSKKIAIAKDKKIATTLSLHIPWEIYKLNLYPGDSLYYWVKLRDSKPFGKLHIATSDTFSFRIPTFAEIRKQVLERENSVTNSIEKAGRENRQLEKKVEKLLKSTSQKNDLSYEEKKIMGDLKKEMDEQKDSLNSAIKAMQDAVKKLNETGANRKLSEKMDLLQRELEKLLSEFGDSLLFNRDDKKSNPTLSELKNALNKMAKMLPNLSERLDKTLAYLKKLKRESERDMLAKQAEHLAKDQMDIAGNLAGDQLKKQETALNKRVKDFLKETSKSLSKDGSPVNEKDFPAMKKVSQNSNKLSKESLDNKSPSQSSMMQMAASLTEMASQMEASLSSSMQKKMRDDQKLLFKMAENSSSLSEWQKMIDDNNELMSTEQLATQQQALKKALIETQRQLEKLSVLSPSKVVELYEKMQKSSQEMDKAVKNIYSPIAKRFMKSAMSSLNAVTANLLSSASNMGKQGSGSGSGEGGNSGGMSGGLKKLSGQQAAVNSATSSMLKSMLGKKSGEKEGAGSSSKGSKQLGGENDTNAKGEAARKAVEKAQREIGEKLKKLAKKYKNSGDEQLKKRVEEMANAAEKLARQLESPSSKIEEKQNIFLKRMLESTISINKKDDQKDERESEKSNSLYNSKVIQKSDLDISKTDQFYQIRTKALNQNYPLIYRKKISNYFDKLQKHIFSDKVE